MILASGHLTPGAAELASTSAIPDQAAIPPMPDAGDTIDPFGEWPEFAGESGADEAPVETEQATETTEPAEPLEPEQAAGPQDEDDQKAASGQYTVIVNDRVQHFVERYTGARRQIIGIWLTRSQRYVDMIHEVFRAQGLPEELAFMAMIESGFNPKAVSRAGAKGLWQFMAATARQYGLRVDRWVDERLDPVKSTHAAAAYLRDLHRQFGSWVLVKAAYNAGEFRVARAIEAAGTNDFWALAQSQLLRQETKDFVPAIHAVTLIGRDPARYGFELEPVEAQTTESVAVPPRTKLQTVAARAGIPWSVLRALNPALIRGVTPPDRSWKVTVPEGSAKRVVTALKSRFTATKVNGKTRMIARDVYIVQPGDTVGAIAKRYGISTADVRRWNNLEAPDLIRPGDRLRIADLQLVERGSAASR